MAPSSGDAGGDHHLAGSRCPQSLGVKENKASNLAASRMGETLPPHPACALGQIGAIWDHAVENWGGVQLRAAFPLHGVIGQAEADHGSVPTGLGVSAGPHLEDGGEAEQPWAHRLPGAAGRSWVVICSAAVNPSGIISCTASQTPGIPANDETSGFARPGRVRLNEAASSPGSRASRGRWARAANLPFLAGGFRGMKRGGRSVGFSPSWLSIAVTSCCCSLERSAWVETWVGGL